MGRRLGTGLGLVGIGIALVLALALESTGPRSSPAAGFFIVGLMFAAPFLVASAWFLAAGVPRDARFRAVGRMLVGLGALRWLGIWVVVGPVVAEGCIVLLASGIAILGMFKAESRAPGHVAPDIDARAAVPPDAVGDAGRPGTLRAIRFSAIGAGAFVGYVVPAAVVLWASHSLLGASNAREAFGPGGYPWAMGFLHGGGPLAGGFLAARIARTQPLLHALLTGVLGWMLSTVIGNGLLMAFVYVLASVVGAAIWKSRNG